MIGMLAALPLNAGKLYDPVDDLPTANRTGAALFDFNHTASQTITDGKVASISDRFGNGFSAAQSTADSRPTISANGIGSLTTASCDGSNDVLVATATMANVVRNVAGASALATLDSAGGNVNSRVIMFRRPDFSARFSVTCSESMCGVQGEINDASAQVGTTSNTSANLLSAEIDGIAGKLRLRADTHASDTNLAATGTIVDAPASAVTIGAYSATTFQYVGHIADILITPSILADLDRIDYEGWQAQRGSGLASNLPSTHRYRYHRPRTRTPK
jgi:hypothetical protein